VIPILRACEVPTEALDVILLLAHSWGVIIHYPHLGYLGELIALDPSWLATALKSVITARADTGIVHGVLSFQRMAELWKAYTPLVQLQLIQLLQDFELVFPLVAEKACLVPCLLDKTPVVAPKLVPNAQRVCRLFSFPVLPANIFPRFLVRTYRYSVGTHGSAVGGDQQTGDRLGLPSCSRQECWLADKEQYGHVQVAESSVSSTISINVWGSSPSAFLSILCDSLDTLLREPFYDRLREYVQRKVPCPSCLSDKKDPQCFDVISLERRLRSSKRMVECPGCEGEFDVRQLLNLLPQDQVIGSFILLGCFWLCRSLTAYFSQMTLSSNNELCEVLSVQRQILREIQTMGAFAVVSVLIFTGSSLIFLVCVCCIRIS
jgi:hypothetical protein